MRTLTIGGPGFGSQFILRTPRRVRLPIADPAAQHSAIVRTIEAKLAPPAPSRPLASWVIDGFKHAFLPQQLPPKAPTPAPGRRVVVQPMSDGKGLMLLCLDADDAKVVPVLRAFCMRVLRIKHVQITTPEDLATNAARLQKGSLATA